MDRLPTTASPEQRQRAQARRDAVAKARDVSGSRILYQIGVEGRWFEGRESTPFGSVFYSEWEDFVGAYCLKMSVL